MATLAEMQTTAGARSLTNDAATSLRMLNDAYKDVVSKARLNPKQGTITLIANSGSYALATLIADFNGVLSLRFTGASPSQSLYGPLEPVSLAFIEQQRATSLYTAIPTTYAIAGFDKLEIWPPPQVSGDTLNLWYIGVPTALAAAGDIPTLVPSEYHDVIELRAAMRLAGTFESAGDNRTLKAEIDAEYQQRLGELRAFVRRHQTDQPRRLRTGYPKQQRVRPATPSSDVSYRGSGW